jgi:hypothetical protein
VVKEMEIVLIIKIDIKLYTELVVDTTVEIVTDLVVETVYHQQNTKSLFL